jgi:hypothetical protein
MCKISGVPEGKGRAEKTFGKTMTEQFPNLMKTISHRYKNFNKLQTQET